MKHELGASSIAGILVDNIVDRACERVQAHHGLTDTTLDEFMTNMDNAGTEFPIIRSSYIVNRAAATVAMTAGIAAL